MPHPKHRKARTRTRILEAASRLFASRGFEATSIEQVMLECGLTRGGFYTHFHSKAHLYEEALRDGHLPRLADASQDGRSDWLRQLFAACSDDAPMPAEWAFLVTDVASAQPQIRSSYLRAVDTMVSSLAAHFGSRAALTDDAEQLPLAAAAMLIGAMAISSSVDSAPARMAVLTACRDVLQRLAREGHPTFFWALERPSS